MNSRIRKKKFKAVEEFAQNIYGQLAKMAGFPHHSRHVGKVLSKLPKDTRLPWYRVVNSQGKISLSGEAFLRQKIHLEKEGIEVTEEGKIVKFKQYLD